MGPGINSSFTDHLGAKRYIPAARFTGVNQEKVRNNGRLLSPPSFSARALPGAKSFIATSLHRMLQKLRQRTSYFLLIWNLFSLSSSSSSSPLNCCSCWWFPYVCRLGFDRPPKKKVQKWSRAKTMPHGAISSVDVLFCNSKSRCIFMSKHL